MKAAKVRELSTDEIRTQLDEAREELMNLLLLAAIFFCEPHGIMKCRVFTPETER